MSHKGAGPLQRRLSTPLGQRRARPRCCRSAGCRCRNHLWFRCCPSYSNGGFLIGGSPKPWVASYSSGWWFSYPSEKCSKPPTSHLMTAKNCLQWPWFTRVLYFVHDSIFGYPLVNIPKLWKITMFWGGKPITSMAIDGTSGRYRQYPLLLKPNAGASVGTGPSLHRKNW